MSLRNSTEGLPARYHPTAFIERINDCDGLTPSLRGFLKILGLLMTYCHDLYYGIVYPQVASLTAIQHSDILEDPSVVAHMCDVIKPILEHFLASPDTLGEPEILEIGDFYDPLEHVVVFEFGDVTIYIYMTFRDDDRGGPLGVDYRQNWTCENLRKIVESLNKLVLDTGGVGYCVNMRVSIHGLPQGSSLYFRFLSSEN